MKCQLCGTILQARRLRILHSSEELADAVDFRTRLQAEISGKGCETFSLKISGKDCKFSKPKGSIDKDAEETPTSSKSVVSENLASKKNMKSIFLDLLESTDGKMKIEEFRQKTLEKGISPEKFDLILKKLLEKGDLYSPEPGIIEMV